MPDRPFHISTKVQAMRVKGCTLLSLVVMSRCLPADGVVHYSVDS